MSQREYFQLSRFKDPFHQFMQTNRIFPWPIQDGLSSERGMAETIRVAWQHHVDRIIGSISFS